jgi:hypothetical protein
MTKPRQKKRRLMGRPPMVTREDVRAVLEAVELRKSLTLESLAAKRGLSYSTVSKIAAGWQPKSFAGAQP